MHSAVCNPAAQPVGTVAGWGGYLDIRELHSPTPLTNGVKLAQRNCLVLTETGEVLSPGSPSRSELTNIVAVASGDERGVALTRNGVMLSWAYDQQGPAQILASNIIAIAAGGNHSLALTEDHRVLSWGGGNVPANLTNVEAIAAGQLHSLAVKRDGTVVAWGDNKFDQCSVPLGLTGVVMVAGGHTHSLALKSDGTVVGWGAGSGNDSGQTRTPPDATNVVAIAAGGFHSLALRASGTIAGWGWNGFGQLEIPPSDSSFIGIAAGEITSFALTRLPVVTAQPLGQSVRAGTNVTIVVEAVGTYPWEYQWFHNGTNLAGATSPSLHVHLADVQVEDSGHYSAILRNSYGSRITSSASLDVQAYPPELTIQPTNQQRLAGGIAAFAVQASGAPPLFYQWFFNDSVLEGATNATLMLTNVVEVNEGRYKVETRNLYGTNISATATLTVNYPPTITNTVTSLTLSAGTNWILRAFVEGNLPIQYQWQFQGLNIAAATNASLVLSNIQATHAGTYSLVASNAFGVVTNAIYHLAVRDSAPVIYAPPVSQAFRPGDTLRLRVLAYGSEPLEWQWWHNGNAIGGTTKRIS